MFASVILEVYKISAATQPAQPLSSRPCGPLPPNPDPTTPCKTLEPFPNLEALLEPFLNPHLTTTPCKTFEKVWCHNTSFQTASQNTVVKLPKESQLLALLSAKSANSHYRTGTRNTRATRTQQASRANSQRFFVA